MRHGIPVDSDGIPDLWSSRECRGLLAALRMTFSSLNDRIALSLVSSRADLKYDDLLPTVQELRKAQADWTTAAKRSEEHTSELQSLMRTSYAVFCLKKKHKSSIIIPDITSKKTKQSTETRNN